MYQKVILIGRLGKKTIRYTKEKKAVSQYSLATTKSVLNEETNVWDEKTEWHRLVSFGAIAEHVEANLQSGDVLRIEGELRTRSWRGDDGNDRYVTEIVVDGYPQKLPRYYKERDGTLQQPQQPQQPQSTHNSYQEAKNGITGNYVPQL